MMNVLLLDAYNLIHRARSGFQKGEHAITFNFFRGLRPLIEQFKPDICYFVLEGTPKKNLGLMPEYKGNRSTPTDDFSRQKDEIIDLIRSSFPIGTAVHKDHEADDVIAAIATRWCNEEDHEVTIISNDSDFIQLLQGNKHIKLWNWLKKEFITPPSYDYVKWKALRGDGTDNIMGVPGVGDKTAIRLLEDTNLFDKRVIQGGMQELYERNLQVIRFHEFSSQELSEIRVDETGANWGEVKNKFETWDFKSMLKEKTWKKYTSTFDSLA